MVKPSDIFQCQMCGDCCRGYGGTFVNEREIQRISEYLKTDTKTFLSDYCTLSGGRPLIKTSESGYCIFWDKVCTIHKVKPRMCRVWPFIEAILIDPSNWSVIKSMCPGIRTDVSAKELTACVRQVLQEYEREERELFKPST
ncbi:MAG: YkgJ family cysteine cluster protein [Deltaproteobacteria bacterium]|nr:MAG: YkgJ family cysteine cluster protein [Deltaproteobacteria bacterium]RLC08450.1 MAG: YkgJ family cysteine cluster protein [Deltaproteobacteria bacterium]